MASLAQIANFSFIPAPWRWLPVLVMIGIGIDAFGTVTFSVASLFIPIAAMLGSRYGRQGFAAVAIGGLPALLQWRDEGLFGGIGFDVYVTALIVCSLAASSWPKGIALRPPATVICVLALLLLPLSIGFYGAGDGEFTWRLALAFNVLLYLFVFLLGTTQFSGWRIGAMLAGFTIFGMVLELLQLPQDAGQLFGGPFAELPLLGYTELRFLWMEYGLDSPARLCTALGWFFAGRQVIALSTGGAAPARSWRQTWLPVALLTLVGVGWEANTYLITLTTGDEPPGAFMLLGSFYALPCAALWAGLLLRWRGIALVLALLVLFLVLDGLIRARFDVLDMQLGLYLDDPAAVLGFGVLGIGLRNRLLGASDVLWSWRWTSYILVIAALAPVLFSLESALDFLWMIVSSIGAVVLGKWLAVLRKRYLGWLPAHDGWLALLWLLAFMVVAVRGRDMIVQMAAIAREWLVSAAESLRAGDGWYEPEGEELMAVLVLCGGLILFFSILKRVLLGAPSCGRDLSALISVVRGTAPHGSPPTQHAAGSGWPRITRWVMTAMTFARSVTVAVLIAVLVVQAGFPFYPRDGMLAMVKGWFVPEREQFADLADDTAETEPAVNPYLWQAVNEAYAQLPGTMNANEGAFETDWYSIAGGPDERRLLAIEVGDALESYALGINLRVQRRGLFGLWVEQERYWDPRLGEFAGVDTFSQEQEIKESLLMRARELAAASTD